MIKKLISFFIPPDSWKSAAAVILGIFTGFLILIIHVSNATSYLSDDPKTCINCHVMYPHYASWSKSSHQATATCVDCHVPNDNIFRKYAFKAKDGFMHSTYFTFRWEPQVLKIKSAGTQVVQDNCIRCHLRQVDMVQIVEVTRDMANRGDGKLCWECHRDTPHGTVKSLSSSPHSVVERLPTVLPTWLEQFMNKE
ncbi:MAG: cytochrome c nitrite reductase small subunit [Bacteroidetes bacterium]|nr:cytochrome c nitrite reductase small subunit [Bacteroidota bacterium]